MNVITIAPTSSSLGRNANTNDVTDASTSFQLNLYTDLPTYELSLDEFEIYALKRLKILKKLEQLRNIRGVDGSTIEQKIIKLLNEDKFNDPSCNIDDASHHILRLSYCRTNELRTWFLRYEVDLFRIRCQTVLKSSSPKQIRKLLQHYPDVQLVPEHERDNIRTEVAKVVTEGLVTNTIYCVPFTEVLKLVGERKCYLKNGKAYVLPTQVLEIICTKFKNQLAGALASIGKRLCIENTTDTESGRLGPLIFNLDKVLLNREPDIDTLTSSLGDVTLTSNTVDTLVHHMPLCMRIVHDGMVQDKKLKYNGRLQYSLFLKGAGLSLEDSLHFFQRHFKAVTAESFNKEYSYFLRHIYGKEGKRESKRPYNCSKIIIGSPAPVGAMQHHGCPYKHYDESYLSNILTKYRVGSTSSERNEIIKLKQNHQYQLACQKHFEYQHPNAAGHKDITLDNVGNHPNAWFRSSIDYAHHYQDKSGTSSTSNTVSPLPDRTRSNATATRKSDSPQPILTSTPMDEDQPEIITSATTAASSPSSSSSPNAATGKRSSAEVSP